VKGCISGARTGEEQKSMIPKGPRKKEERSKRNSQHAPDYDPSRYRGKKERKHHYEGRRLSSNAM